MAQSNKQPGGVVPRSQEPPFDTKVASEFLEYLKSEAENKRLEIQAGEKDGQRAHEYALAAMSATREDNKERRDYRFRAVRLRLILAIISLVIVAGFTIVLAMMGKDQLAIEVLKAAGYLLAGGTGGYFAGKNRGSKEEKEGRSPDD